MRYDDGWMYINETYEYEKTSDTKNLGWMLNDRQ